MRDRALRARAQRERTATLYGISVRFFADWLIAHDHPPTLDELTRTAVREWLADLVESGKAPGPCAPGTRDCAQFCGWLVTEGELAAHPMVGLEVPAVPDKPVLLCPTTT